MNTSPSPAERMRDQLERIWKYNANRAEALDYELVVLAIPRFPANIEAIASLDMDTLCELMQGYIDARKAQNEERRNVLHQIEQQPEPAPPGTAPASEAAEAGQASGAADGQALGQDNGDAGGARQGRGDPPPEAGEGDAAAGPVGRELTPEEIEEIEEIANEKFFEGEQWTTEQIEAMLRERRIAAAVAIGTPCGPSYKSTKCAYCGEGPCTGMHPRVDVG